MVHRGGSWGALRMLFGVRTPQMLIAYAIGAYAWMRWELSSSITAMNATEMPCRVCNAVNSSCHQSTDRSSALKLDSTYRPSSSR